MSFMTEWAKRHPDAAHPFFGSVNTVQVLTPSKKPASVARKRVIPEREEEIIRRLYQLGLLQKKQIAQVWGVSVDTIYKITGTALGSSHDR